MRLGVGIGAFEAFDIDRVQSTDENYEKALDRFFVSLDLAKDSIEFTNEACTSRYVCLYIMAAVSLFPDLKLTAERDISGRCGNGPVDYAIYFKTELSCMLGVTEVKHEVIKKWFPQHMIQLDATLTNCMAQDH